MSRKTLFKIACLMLIVPQCSFSAWGSSEDDFSKLVELGESSDAQEIKVEYFRKALLARPNNNGNVEIEFEIASALNQRPPIKRREALQYYERVLNSYDYDDYYHAHWREGGNWKQLPQSLFVQSAIQAGCIYLFEFGDQQKARQYEHLAMEMLYKTFERRKTDWLKEQQPTYTSSPEFLTQLGGEERAIRTFQYRLSKWKETIDRAKAGEVAERVEISNAKIAVKYYGLSYGGLEPELAPIAMGRIIKDFPGTLMAQLAQDQIDRSAKLAPEPSKVRAKGPIVSTQRGLTCPLNRAVKRNRPRFPTNFCF